MRSQRIWRVWLHYEKICVVKEFGVCDSITKRLCVVKEFGVCDSVTKTHLWSTIWQLSRPRVGTWQQSPWCVQKLSWRYEQTRPLTATSLGSWVVAGGPEVKGRQYGSIREGSRSHEIEEMCLTSSGSLKYRWRSRINGRKMSLTWVGVVWRKGKCFTELWRKL